MARHNNLVTLAWHRYLQELERKPLRTKATTAASLAALSDIIAQRLVSNLPLNWRRTVAMAAFGFVWSGPSNHYWQKFLVALFGDRKDAATVVEKVALDQLTYGPVCNVLVMAYIAVVVEGRSWNATQLKLSQDYLNVQRAGWKLWPLASLVNYRFVPLKLRVLFVNLVALCWSTFLITRSRIAVKQVTA